MSDNFRVVESLSTPSELFCIYDYTKIAYLVQGYICIREVVTDEAMPTFLKLQNYNFAHKHFERYIGFASFPNCLVLAQRASNRDINLHFYTHNEIHLKIASQLARRAENDNELQIEIHQSQHYIYLIVKRQIDVEILMVNLEHRQLAGRAFVSGLMQEFKIKHVEGLELFSFFSRDSQQIVEFEVLGVLSGEHSVRVVEKHHLQLRWKELMYCWAGEELIVATKESIHVLVEGREVQSIEDFPHITMITQMLSGFIVVSHSHMRIYKKNSNLYECKSQYGLSCHPSSRLQLSPMEDMLAFYCQKNNSIGYSFQFGENQHEESSRKRNENLPLYSIEHSKEKEIKTYASLQSMFVVSTGSILSIYSPITFQCFLSMRADVRELSLSKKRLLRSTSLVSDKMLNEIGEGEMIETLGVHPMQPIIGVAFRSTVRVYFVLYNQFKVLKDIKMSHCKQIGFNHSGSIMYAKVGGKQGNKIYLYNVLSNFECIEVLSASKPVEMMVWTPLDSQVFGFHQNGYYHWSVDSCFKLRHENTCSVSFAIKGAVVYHNSIVAWGERDIMQIDNHAVTEAIKLDKTLTNLLVQSNNFIMTTAQGELYRCKGFNNISPTLNSQSFTISASSKIYSVRDGIVLCLNQQGNVTCLEWGAEDKSNLQIVGIERRRIEKYQSQYCKYEDKIADVEQRMSWQLQKLKEQFEKRSDEQKNRFTVQMRDKQERYREIRTQKLKTEQTMEENLRAHEQETMQQVKELEKIYERKIAITTNKLLTSEEIGFRNQILAKENLHHLQQKHSEDIVHVRGEYSRNLHKIMQQGDQRDELYQIKKEYETRLSELEQENENLLKRFQNSTQNNLISLKKNVVNLELKYSEAVSQKYNLSKEFEEERIQLQIVRMKKGQLQTKLHEEVRRGEQLTREYNRMQNLVVEKDGTIVCLEKRIQELEKSNEIFKYRIIEIKNISDPKEDEILKLKDNMIELEQEYGKISKKAHEHEQTISLLKKDVAQLRANLGATQVRERKLDKDYGLAMDKLREATKAPIQEIRRMLIRILENFQNPGELKAQKEHKRPNSPLGELNRVREHLEVCLIDAVEIGKKNDKQNNIQISRKNRENSELLREINDLRVKVRDLEAKLKERQTQLQQIERESHQFTYSLKKDRREDRPSTNYETEIPEHGRYKTRESFFEKSMFKGHWREKRLKTEQGTRSKKSTHSLAKQETNHLYIETKGEEIEELRRLLEQKETIIKQLINKIHKLS